MTAPISHSESAPIFLKPWFLKALVGDDLVTSEYQNGEVRAYWPMQRRKTFGLTILQSPDLVPYTGPWFTYPSDMGASKRAREFRKGVTELLHGFPAHHALFGRMNPFIGDFLPFHWEGASVRPRITYRLSAQMGIEEVRKLMKSSNARNLQKARHLSIIEDQDTEVLWDLSKRTFGRQEKEPHFSANQLKRVFNACRKNDAAKLLSARDESGVAHSAILFVRDRHFVYYYLGGSDPVYRNSEAFSALIWEGIKWSRELGLGFDFEGSMLEPIARFFRSWGAEQEVFYEIEHFNSRTAQMLFALKQALKT